MAFPLIPIALGAGAIAGYDYLSKDKSKAGGSPYQGFDNTKYLTQGTQYQGYNPQTGTDAYLNREQQMGVQRFDANAYKTALDQAAVSQNRGQLQAANVANDQAAANSGLGNSTMNRSIGNANSMAANAALLQQRAQIAEGAAGLQQNENQYRMAGAGQMSGQMQQDNQYMYGANEDTRRYDQEANMGAYYDRYYMRNVLPKEQAQAAQASRNQLYGAGIGALGSVAGGALAGRR